MHALDETDRAAVLLRYFENKSLREVGEMLGTSDDAAQKRVSRAVERLREFFNKRGVTTGASGLVVLISANAVQAAPVGLVGTISTAVIAVASAGNGTLSLLKLLTMTKLKLGIISAIVVAAVATPLALQHQTELKLREENQSLRQEIERLTLAAKSGDRLYGSTSSLSNEQRGELLKLRSKVQSLRQQNQELAEAQESSTRTNALPRANGKNFASVLDSPTVLLSPSENWANLGNATPEAAFETLHWAIAKHDTNTFSETLAWDPDARKKAEALFAAAPESVRQRFGSVDGVLYALFSGVSPINGIAVVSENIDGTDGTLVEQHQYADGRVRQNQLNVHRFDDDGWRIVLSDEKLIRGFDAVLKRATAASHR
jgi:hypothetical protein